MIINTLNNAKKSIRFYIVTFIDIFKEMQVSMVFFSQKFRKSQNIFILIVKLQKFKQSDCCRKWTIFGLSLLTTKLTYKSIANLVNLKLFGISTVSINFLKLRTSRYRFIIVTSHFNRPG